MKILLLVLKGIAVGVSNVIPGVSAGTLLVLLGIYDQLIEAVGHFLTNGARRKEYFRFLLPLVLGAVGGVLAFANLISFLLEQHLVPTQFFFIGLILGSIPTVIGMHGDMRPSVVRVVAFGLAVGLVVLLSAGERHGIGESFGADTPALLALSLFVGVGFFAGGAMVTPGVSGAYVFLLTGTYGPIVQALASLTRPPVQWGVIVAVSGGAALGILICSRLIDLVLKKYPAVTFYAILGLICGSFVGLWPADLDLPASSLVGIPTFTGGAIIAYLLRKPVRNEGKR